MGSLVFFGVTIAVLVAVAVLVVRTRRARDAADDGSAMRLPPVGADGAARRALDEAYARGDITVEHYEERVRRLAGG